MEEEDNIRVGDLVATATSRKEYYLVIDVRHYLQYPHKTYMIKSLRGNQKVREVVPDALVTVSTGSTR